MNKKHLLAGALLVALSIVIWLVWARPSEGTPEAQTAGGDGSRDHHASEEQAAATPQSRVETSDPVAIRDAEPERLLRSSKPIENAMVYPDGLMLPALNGVIGKTKVSWPPGMQYTPVVEKQTMPDGTEWYLHEGGIWTTTFYSEYTSKGKRWRGSMGKTVLERPDKAPIRKN